MSISIDRRVNVDTLVIAFAGFNHRLGMPNEKFFESAGLADASKIVVSDESRRFTFFGLGCGLDTFEKVCDRLAHEVATTPHETLVVTGNVRRCLLGSSLWPLAEGEQSRLFRAVHVP